MSELLQEGWYLMSTRDLEIELRRWRSRDPAIPASGALRLSVEEALAYRDAGNLSDELGRTLRLVIVIDDRGDLLDIDETRLRYEPDFHDAPDWRRPGSVPVNVVPLRSGEVAASSAGPWWEDESMRELEQEWQATGAVSGVRVPGDYRSFVFKTVVALRRAGREVTAAAIGDSVARWLAPDEARKLRALLDEANPGPGSPT